MLERTAFQKYLKDEIIITNIKRGMLFQNKKLLSSTLNDIAKDFINKNIHQFIQPQ